MNMKNDEERWHQTVFGRFLIGFAIFAAVMAFLLSPSRKAHSQTPNPEAREFQQLYDLGFRVVMEGVPKFAPKQNVKDIVQVESERALSLVKAFYDITQWVPFENGTYLTTPTMRKAPAWLSVVGKNDRIYERINPFHLERKPPLNALLIKAVPMTPEFAGVCLTHGLFHLVYRFFNPEMWSPTRQQYLMDEAMAYSVEIQLVNHLTSGLFSRRLQEVLVQSGLVDQSQAANFIKSRENAEAVYKYIGPILGSAPAGPEEEALIKGLYNMALCFEAIRKQFKPGEGGERRLALESAIIERIMIESGQNKNLPQR